MKRIILTTALTLAVIFFANAVRPSQAAFLEIVDNMVAGNKDVAVAIARNASVLASLSVNNRLPAPEISFGHLWGQDGIGNKWNIEITQSFDWPGTYRARRTTNGFEAASSAASVAQSVYEARLNTAQAIISTVYYTRLCDLYAANLERVDSLLNLYDRGYRLGEISILDVNKLKLDRISANRALASANEGLTEAMSNLRALNANASADQILSQMTDFPEINLLPLNSYISEATEHNTELEYARSQSKLAEANINVAKQSRYPGFSVGYNHEYEMGERFNGFSVGLTLPFITAGKNVTAARLEKAALDAEAEAIRATLTASIQGAYDKALMLYDEKTQYSKVLSNDDSVRLLNLALKQGQITLIDYMQQVNFFTEAEATFLEVEYNYIQTAIALNLQILPSDSATLQVAE